MDKRFFPLGIELAITLFVSTVLFESKWSLNFNSPFTWLIALLIAFEFGRILFKLGKLRKEGVKIDDESMKSPLFYAVNKDLGEASYKVSKFLKPIYWAEAIVLIFCVIIGGGAVILAVIYTFFPSLFR